MNIKTDIFVLSMTTPICLLIAPHALAGYVHLPLAFSFSQYSQTCTKDFSGDSFPHCSEEMEAVALAAQGQQGIESFKEHLQARHL